MFCWFSITLNTSGNTLAASAMDITGLPFAADATHTVDFAIYWRHSTTSYISMGGVIGNGASTIGVRGMTAAATSSGIATTVNASAGLHTTNGSIMRGAFCYLAN